MITGRVSPIWDVRYSLVQMLVHGPMSRSVRITGLLSFRISSKSAGDWSVLLEIGTGGNVPSVFSSRLPTLDLANTLVAPDAVLACWAALTCQFVVLSF